MSSAARVSTRSLVAVGCIGASALVVAAYVRRLFTSIEYSPAPPSSSLLARASSQQERERLRGRLYEDSFCMSVPLSQLRDSDAAAASSGDGSGLSDDWALRFARSFFSTPLFQLEWTVVHRLLRVCPVSYAEQEQLHPVSSRQFSVGYEMLPGCMAVSQRSPGEMLSEWRLLSASGRQWLSASVSDARVDFRFGSQMHDGLVAQGPLLRLHQLYSRMLIHAAVRGMTT